ncbi:MAG: hypothetical protein AAGJ97_03140, partial [Planctomycetota bacterium]
GVAPTVLDDKRRLGAANGWDIGLLSGLVPAVSMSQRSKGTGTDDPPDVPGDGSPITDDEAKAAADRMLRRGGKATAKA